MLSWSQERNAAHKANEKNKTKNFLIFIVKLIILTIFKKRKRKLKNHGLHPAFFRAKSAQFFRLFCRFWKNCVKMTQFFLEIRRMCQNEPADFCTRDSTLENFGKSLKILRVRPQIPKKMSKTMLFFYIFHAFCERNCFHIISADLTKNSQKLRSWHGICYKNCE